MPNERSRPAGNEAASKTAARDTVPPEKRLCLVPVPSSSRQERISQARRRRIAAARSVPLGCGCRDAWTCRCTKSGLTDEMIDAGRIAALHILAAGQLPILRPDILRALYRRGGQDRQLAERLHILTIPG